MVAGQWARQCSYAWEAARRRNRARRWSATRARGPGAHVDQPYRPAPAVPRARARTIARRWIRDGATIGEGLLRQWRTWGGRGRRRRNSLALGTPPYHFNKRKGAVSASTIAQRPGAGEPTATARLVFTPLPRSTANKKPVDRDLPEACGPYGPGRGEVHGPVDARGERNRTPTARPRLRRATGLNARRRSSHEGTRPSRCTPTGQTSGACAATRDAVEIAANGVGR
jgi:hypothetical protein